MKEDFERALKEYESKHLTGSSGLVRKIAGHFYAVRQAEIDALKRELKAAEDFHVLALEERNAAWTKIAALKTENEQLRKDSELNRQRYLHQVYRSE